MTRKELIERAEFMNVDVLDAMRMRVRFLTERSESLGLSIKKYEDDILLNNSINDVTRAFIELMMERDKKELMTVHREIKAYTQKPKEGEITDDDIETAREFPVENLIEFKGGRCIAFCHPSNSYSMVKSRNGNYVWCNVCSLAHNPVDILMRRDGYSFIDAVKQLI